MKSWKSNFSAVLIAETLAIAGFALSMPIIPLFLREDIGMTDTRELKIWVGVIQAVPAVMLAIFAPIWGRLADVYSRRLMLLRAMFGGAIVVSLMFFVNSPWQLLFLRSLQGCLTGTITAATVLTAGIAPVSHVAFALGLLQTGIAVGNSIGPLMGGVISDFLGHRIAFLSTGLTLALAGFIVLRFVEEDFKPVRSEKKSRFSFVPNIKPILNSPALITMMIATFAIQAANSISGPMLPLFVADLISGDRFIGSSTGFVLGVGAATTALAAVLVGKFSAQLGYWKTLIYCLTLCAIFTIPQAFVTSVGQLVLFRAIASFFIGGSSPVIHAIIAISTEKKDQGSVYGFNSSTSAAGNAVGPMIGSFVAMINYRAVFLAAAALLGIASYGTFKRRQEKIRPMV